MEVLNKIYVSTYDGDIYNAETSTFLITDCIEFDPNEWDTNSRDIFKGFSFEQMLGYAQYCKYASYITPENYDIIQDQEQ